MADSLLIRAGKKATMPALLYRELGYCYDTKELYVGGVTGSGNQLVGSVVWESDISTLKAQIEALEVFNEALNESIESLNEGFNTLESTVEGKLTASQAENVLDVTAEAELSAVITAFNAALANLRAAGIMKSS